MHFLLFVPRERCPAGDATDRILDAVGLPDLTLGARPERIDKGPDGGPGMLFRYDRANADPGTLDWVKAHPDRREGLPAGRYWLGFAKPRVVGGNVTEGACHPSELLRPYAFGGREVALGDGNGWLVPTASDLGFDLASRDDGSWRFVLQRRYHAFGLEVAKWRQKVADGSIVAATAEQILRFGLEALRLNFRLPPEAANHLRLFDQLNIRDVWFAGVGEKKR